MPEQQSIQINIRYSGGDADENHIDMYDGSLSLLGFSKALLISGHFLINGKVIFQAPSATGVNCYLRIARPGSWDQVIDFVVNHGDAAFVFGAAVGGGAVKDVLKDYLKQIFSKCVGRTVKASTDYVRDLFTQREGDLSALCEATEGALRDAHRTINDDRGKVSIGCDGERLIRFDRQTKDYLFTRHVSSHLEDIRGTFASYNINSRKGRIFDHDLGRTVPFELIKGTPAESSLAVTWSMDERNNGKEGIVVATVQREVTVNGETRRYLVHGVKPA